MKIKKKIRSFIKLITNGKMTYYTDNLPVMNVNYSSLRKQKKVLICYLDVKKASLDIINATSGKSGAIHTNRYELFEIINSFIELDYCIDIVSNNDLYGMDNFLRTREYDVVFGLGKTFRYSLELFPDAKKILYMTENPYYISYEREAQRLQYYKQRTGRTGKLFRTGMFFKENDEMLADGIICVGEESFFEKCNIPVRRVIPSAFIPDGNIDYSEREQNSFIIFGTDGMIHKGIDIAIEVFTKHPEWKLFLCGYGITKGVKKLGYDSLPPNIYDCGYLIPGTDRFLEIIKKTSHVISLSCSEGTPTGVLTCMAHGVLPIVTRENGFEILSEYCDFFDDYNIESVEKKIRLVVNEDFEKTMGKFQKTKDYVCSKFNLLAYKGNFKMAVIDMTKEMGIM